MFTNIFKLFKNVNHDQKIKGNVYKVYIFQLVSAGNLLKNDINP